MRKSVIITLTTVLAVVIVAAIGGISAKSPSFAPTVRKSTGLSTLTTSSPSTPGAQQVTWLCQEARTQVKSHTASAFMDYAHQRCDKEGPTGLSQSLHTSTPLGALICQYADRQVAAKAATKTDQMMANGCSRAPQTQPTGIFAGQAAPRGFDIATTNSWVGYVNGNYISVLAGAEEVVGANGLSAVTQIGKVMVLGGPNNATVATTTSADGALRITGANDGVLSLVAQDGVHYRFDVQDGDLTRLAQ